MHFVESDRARELTQRVKAFMDEHVYPVEDEANAALDREVDADTPFPAVIREMRERAKAQGLWNLFLPDERFGPGLSNLEYGTVCEEIGRSSFVAPYAFNTQPPDSGNMEIIAEHGTPEQRERWLQPLLEGDIRSCYSMTEPHTAGSDPTGLATTARLEGDEWVIEGRKWWTTNALGAALAIVMVVTDPDAAPHQRASMLLVPTDAPGFRMVRPISHMGHSEGPGHWEIAYERCRVPADSLLGERGAGFRIAQDRLGPGRIHHCMRLIGMAERAVELMCQRAIEREAFGKPLARQGVIQNWIAESRCEIEQARLLVLKAAWMMDTVGNKAAKSEIAMIKVVAPRMAQRIIDRAIQVFGGAGVSQDTPLATAFAHARTLRLADGPDEVHLMSVARQEFGRYLS